MNWKISRMVECPSLRSSKKCYIKLDDEPLIPVNSTLFIATMYKSITFGHARDRVLIEIVPDTRDIGLDAKADLMRLERYNARAIKCVISGIIRSSLS